MSAGARAALLDRLVRFRVASGRMSPIHIARDRQPLGRFSEEDVVEGLRSGRFLPTDLAWREPMETWKPLAEFEFSPAEAASTPVVGPVEAEPVLPPAPPEPAWERREEIGLLKAAVLTMKQVFFDPAATFRNMARTGGFLGPFLFCYPMGIFFFLLHILFDVGWAILLPEQTLAFYREASVRDFLFGQAAMVPFVLVFSLVTPFAISGIYHLAVMLLAKSHGNYETTFRTYCYLSGALAPASALPFPPFLAAFAIYFLLLVGISVAYLTIALRESHRTTTVIALLSTIFPPLIFSCCCVFAAGVLGASAGVLAKGLIP